MGGGVAFVIQPPRFPGVSTRGKAARFMRKERVMTIVASGVESANEDANSRTLSENLDDRAPILIASTRPRRCVGNPAGTAAGPDMEPSTGNSTN